MYTINQAFGIGQVTESNDQFTTVYFEDVDKTKKLITSHITIYATIEEAELALNPEMSNEEAAATWSECQKEQEAYNKGLVSMAFLREYNADMARRQAKHI
jgi:hypothetical protein